MQQRDFWKTDLGKAFVPALLIHKTPYPTDDGLELAWITSGIVVEAEGMWFWVTARHSLDQLRERLEKSPGGSLQFRPPGKRETAAGEVLSEEMFFAYDEARRLDPAKISEQALVESSEDDEDLAVHRYVSGLDINALTLTQLDVVELKSIGVKPLTIAQSWRPEDHEGLDPREVTFGIAGVPNGDVKMKAGRPEQWAYTVLPIRLVSEEGPITRFAPLWSENEHAGSVKGMSGGPAFIEFRENLYWCGVQSEETTRGGRVVEVRVCPSWFIMKLLPALVKESKRIQAEGGEPWSKA